jgi:glycosyltransferase involved in cell wall biosynthesis
MWSQSNPFAIVLCTYNGERYLDAQLRTLRAQEGVAEIVVSDDGSTDGTMAILHRHAAEDARMRISRNETRLGVTANFQKAIGLAHAPWIALSDQDDLWLPGKLARLRACWDGDSCLVHHASYKFRGSSAPKYPRHAAGERRKFSGRDWRRLLYRNTVVGHAAVFRADLARQLTPFPDGLPHDWWIGLGAAIHGEVQYVDEYLVLYRIHDRNAYHAAGSRLERLREEHWLRRSLLQALVDRWELPARERAFTEKYLALLCESSAGAFPWRLWWFYLCNASLFFGGAYFNRSEATYFRKSCVAALAVMFQPAARSAHRPAQYALQ